MRDSDSYFFLAVVSTFALIFQLFNLKFEANKDVLILVEIIIIFLNLVLFFVSVLIVYSEIWVHQELDVRKTFLDYEIHFFSFVSGEINKLEKIDFDFKNDVKKPVDKVKAIKNKIREVEF